MSGPCEADANSYEFPTVYRFPKYGFTPRLTNLLLLVTMVTYVFSTSLAPQSLPTSSVRTKLFPRPSVPPETCLRHYLQRAWSRFLIQRIASLFVRWVAGRPALLW